MTAVASSSVAQSREYPQWEAILELDERILWRGKGVSLGDLLFYGVTTVFSLGGLVYATLDHGPKASVAAVCFAVFGVSGLFLFFAYVSGVARCAYCVTDRRAIAWQHFAGRKLPTVGEVELLGAETENFLDLKIIRPSTMEGRRVLLLRAPRSVRCEISKYVDKINAP